MKVGELKKALENFDDDLEIMTKKHEVFGNVGNVFFLEKSSYGSLGSIIDCVLLTDSVDNEDDYENGVLKNDLEG